MNVMDFGSNHIRQASKLKAHNENVQWPNVRQLAALFASLDIAQQNMPLKQAKQCINPGFAYFKDCFKFHTQ